MNFFKQREKVCNTKMWKRNPNKKEREKPNRLKLKPTIGFRSNLSPLVLGYLKKLSTNKAKSDFINLKLSG